MVRPRQSANGHVSVLSEALKLCAMGFAVVPCSGKKALVTDWPNRTLSAAELRGLITAQTGIAIALNRTELIDVECDSPEAERELLELCDGNIPATPTWQSQRGRHRLFRRPEGLPDKAKAYVGAIECRIANRGALSLVPPTEGRRWLPGLSIQEIEPAELPEALTEMLRATVERPTPRAGGGIVAGSRNETLFRVACSMRRSGVAQVAIEAALSATNAAECEPPLDAAEVRSIADSAMRYEPTTSPGSNSFNLFNLFSTPELGEAARYGFVGDFLRTVEPYTEATAPGILAHLLPAVAMACGPPAYIWAGSEQPARLNTVLVGPTSSGRKGTSFVPVNLLMREVDRQAKQRLWADQRVTGLSSGEGLIQFVADKRVKDDDGNEEIEVAEKRVYVVEEELATVLIHAQRQGNILSQIVRQAFDSGDLQKITVQPVRAEGAHINIVGHITPQELAARFNEIEMANGFGNRFLWFAVKSEKNLPDSPRIPKAKLAKLAARLVQVIDFAQRQGAVERDENANDLWKERYRELKEDQPGLEGALVARGTTFVLRIALVYALLDRSAKIRRPHLEAALAVWDYNMASVRLLFAHKSGDGLADRLLSLLTKGPMKKADLYGHVGKSKGEIDASLENLRAAGRVRMTKVKPSGAGRPAERWEIEPPTPETN